MLLAIFPEDGVYQLAFSHLLGNRDVEFFTNLAELCLIHACDIHACIFFDGIKYRQSAVRRLEIDFLLSDSHFGRSVQGDGDLLKHLLHELHHPDIVLVGHIDFHAGKLRIVGLVHAFIAEILRELIYS